MRSCRRLCLRSCTLLALAVLSVHAQTQPSAADREEARRQGEERSRQQREREQSNINNTPDANRPRAYPVHGKILMAAGGPPPERVAVTAICGGRAAARTVSSDKGEFGLHIGGSGSASQLSEIDCVLLAELAGFRAEPVPLEGLQSSGRVSFATIVLKPIEGVSGYTFSATSMYASPEARKAQEKESAALAKNKLGEAEKELRRAVELQPNYAAAWYDLGRTLIQARKVHEARKALESSAAADPKYINPHPHLAQLALNEQRWEDVARHTATVIALNPFFSVDSYVFSAQANLVLQKLDLAESHARAAINLDNAHRFPVAHRLLARVLEKKGSLHEAILQLELCMTHTTAGPHIEQIRGEIASLQQQVSQR